MQEPEKLIVDLGSLLGVTKGYPYTIWRCEKGTFRFGGERLGMAGNLNVVMEYQKQGGFWVSL